MCAIRAAWRKPRCRAGCGRCGGHLFLPRRASNAIPPFPERRTSMPIRTRLLLAGATLSALLLSAPAPAPAAPAAATVVLAPHRAVYDLRLLRTRGRGDIEAVRGRIVYDFSGSACAGY